MCKGYKLSLCFGAVLYALLSTGCTSSKITQVDTQPIGHKVEVVAVDMNSGVLGEAITRAIKRKGYTALETAELYHLLQRLRINDLSVNDPDSLSKLYDSAEIDAYIVSKTTKLAITGHIQTATILVFSTHSGNMFLSLGWENGRGGMVGSQADYDSKKDPDAAADEIVTELIKHFNQ